jgi:hypothetical protein
MAYEKESEAVVVSAGKIIASVKDFGITNPQTIMVLLGELMRMTTVASFYLDLPADQKDDFLTQVFDASIGDEETALLKKAAFFDADALEIMSDGLKAAFLAYMNKAVIKPAA